MSTSFHSEHKSVLPVKNTSINVPIKQTTTEQKKNAAERGSGFELYSMGSFNPTHTVLSANISHPNGEQLFGEELHIGPTALNLPIEY